MRVVVALAEPPLVDGGAVGRCAVGLLQGLRHHGIDVLALAARQPFAVPGDPPPGLPVEVVDVPAVLPSWSGRIAYYVTRPCGDLAKGVFQHRLREVTSGADVFHLEEIRTAWCDLGITTPSVVHIHHRARFDRGYGAPWAKQFRELVAVTRAERAAMRRHRNIIANSPVVADSVRRQAPAARVVVAPLTLDPDHYSRAPLDGPPFAGLVGTASWTPTSRAIQRLLRLWPRVRARVPQARLLIAGRGTERIDTGDVPGVDALGPVTSSAEFLRGMSVLLYPLYRGSGMKVKVLESLATGLPVVTTACGAEGIDGGDGVIVAEDDGLLVDAAVHLLTDPLARAQRGAAARSAFEQRYAPVPATAPLVDLYRSVISSS